MPIFFAFSDESGKYKKERTDKFISKNPYYCRSAVVLEGEEWIRLKEEFTALKKRLLNLPPEQDVKWSHIWSLYKHFQKKEKIPGDKPYYSLRHIPLDSLVDFIRQVLETVKGSKSCSVMLTVTFNDRKRTRPRDTKEIVSLHMTHLLDGVEKEMKKAQEGVCVFFFNREEPFSERIIKDAFAEIFKEGMSKKYPHIKDSLNFEQFPQSFGAQLADYYAGVFNGCLRFYPQSIDLFRNQVWPKIIKLKDEALGRGISEIPHRAENRVFLRKILEKIFETEENAYRVSLKQRLGRG